MSIKMYQSDISEKSFGINILLMKIVGIYPYDFCPQIYKIYTYISYIIFIIPTPVLSSINIFVGNKVDLEEVSDNAFLILQTGALLLKLLPFINNSEGVKRTIKTLNKSIFKRLSQQQEHIILDVIRECRYIFSLFFTFCMASLFTWPCKVLGYEDRKLPTIEVWLPFDALKDTRLYVGVFVFIVIGVANAAIGNAALDTLIAGLVYHAAGQLKILKDTLQHLNKRVDEEISNETKGMNDVDKEKLKSEIIFKKICQCVDHYDAVFEFVCDLEDTYSFVVFTQFIASIIVICISCLQLSIVEPFTIVFFAMIIYLTTMLTEIYLYCYYGTVLYEESDTIINAIYMSDWYNYDQKSKKALMTLMERAKRPMKVTAGKLLDLSLATFTMIIRRSYSLLAVLKNY